MITDDCDCNLSAIAVASAKSCTHDCVPKSYWVALHTACAADVPVGRASCGSGTFGRMEGLPIGGEGEHDLDVCVWVSIWTVLGEAASSSPDA